MFIAARMKRVGTLRRFMDSSKNCSENQMQNLLSIEKLGKCLNEMQFLNSVTVPKM